MIFWIRCVSAFILAWIIMVYTFLAKFDEQSKLKSKLEYAKLENENLNEIVEELKRESLNTIKIPNIDYELTRRRVENNIEELYNYFRGKFNDSINLAIKDPSHLQMRINEALALGAEHKRSLLYDMQVLRKMDGYETWRQMESADLSDLMQRRIAHLQNPENCENARRLACQLNKNCGFACQLHHVAYCLIVGYATQRTVILHSKGWLYHKEGWEDFFLPLSETCRNTTILNARKWPGNNETLMLKLPIIDKVRKKPDYLPRAIPADLARRLKRLHGNPFAWWLAQFLKYILRAQPETAHLLERGISEFDWKQPIVGIHVRRTDKLKKEAKFHNLTEYMFHVEEYFRTLELNNSARIRRRIFIATDDETVLEEARLNYGNYEILSNLNGAYLANNLTTRFSENSLQQLLLDINALAQTDYLVCTFSSQFCRLAYELMQTRLPDAATLFKSLDESYYFGGQQNCERVAITANVAYKESDLELEIGDRIDNIKNLNKTGYSMGTNRRTNMAGVFPKFKIGNIVQTAHMPRYVGV